MPLSNFCPFNSLGPGLCSPAKLNEAELYAAKLNYTWHRAEEKELKRAGLGEHAGLSRFAMETIHRIIIMLMSASNFSDSPVGRHYLSNLFTVLTSSSSALIAQGTDTPSTSSAFVAIPACVGAIFLNFFQSSAVLCVMPPRPIQEISYMPPLNGAGVDATANADHSSTTPPNEAPQCRFV